MRANPLPEPVPLVPSCGVGLNTMPSRSTRTHQVVEANRRSFVVVASEAFSAGASRL